MLAAKKQFSQSFTWLSFSDGSPPHVLGKVSSDARDAGVV